MADRRRQPPQPDPDETPKADPYNANDEEARPGETMDDYMERRDAEESQWEGKQGGRGASKHDANESRHPPKWSEEYDPHLGCL